MTNYNERLDEVVERIRRGMRRELGGTSPHLEAGYTRDEAKQAILDWVADEVISEDEEETIEDKLGGKYRFNSNKRRRNRVRRNQRNILARHGYKGDQR